MFFVFVLLAFVLSASGTNYLKLESYYGSLCTGAVANSTYYTDTCECSNQICLEGRFGKSADCDLYIGYYVKSTCGAASTTTANINFYTDINCKTLYKNTPVTLNRCASTNVKMTCTTALPAIYENGYLISKK